LSNRVVQPVWQTRFDNRLNVCIHDTAGCQTGCQTGLTTGLTTVLNEQLFVQPVVKPCLTNRFDKHGLTTGWMFVYTIQPVVKPVVKRVWQPVWQPCWTNSCSFNRLSKRVVQSVDNGFDNRLYRVYKHLPGCQTDWQPVWQLVVSCKRGLKVDNTSVRSIRRHSANNCFFFRLAGKFLLFRPNNLLLQSLLHYFYFFTAWNPTYHPFVYIATEVIGKKLCCVWCRKLISNLTLNDWTMDCYKK